METKKDTPITDLLSVVEHFIDQAKDLPEAERVAFVLGCRQKIAELELPTETVFVRVNHLKILKFINNNPGSTVSDFNTEFGNKSKKIHTRFLELYDMGLLSIENTTGGHDNIAGYEGFAKSFSVTQKGKMILDCCPHGINMDEIIHSKHQPPIPISIPKV